MAVFAISFRIKQVGNYTERYESLVSAIKAQAIGTTWEETTSFFVIKSSKDTNSLAGDLYTVSSMATTDKLLVVNLSIKDYATRGEIEYPNTLAGL
jgi:hypothetical protein